MCVVQSIDYKIDVLTVAIKKLIHKCKVDEWNLLRTRTSRLNGNWLRGTTYNDITMFLFQRFYDYFFKCHISEDIKKITVVGPKYLEWFRKFGKDDPFCNNAAKGFENIS